LSLFRYWDFTVKRSQYCQISHQKYCYKSRTLNNMVATNNDLFRKKALERASSPEQLDQVIQLVRLHHWLPLVAFSSLMAAGIAWSIMGRIPVTVAGQGVLIYPSTVVDIQSLGAGQLSHINARVGDFVKKGDVLATLAQPDLENQMRLKQIKLVELETQSNTAHSLQTNRSGIADGVLTQQRQSLQNQIQLAQNMVPQLKDRLSRWQWLKNQGAVSGEDVIKVQQEYLQATEKAVQLSSQLKELDIKKPEQTEKDYETVSNRQNQIQDIKREIAQLKGQLKQNSQIIAQRNGQIIEMTIASGQILATGDRVATLEAREPSTKLVGLSYFANGEGKQIQPGMKVEMTPTSVHRERFGGIVGTVSNISTQPVTPEGVAKLTGNATLAKSLMGEDSKIQISADLQTDPTNQSGFHWSSSKGPQFKVSAGSTTSVRITVEERAPITFVFPFLKSWSGLS
jgi:HlyD family secretion protein